jgi:DNA-binding NarL/FixJ family response regulator
MKSDNPYTIENEQQSQPEEVGFFIDGTWLTIGRLRIIILQSYGLPRKNIADILRLHPGTIDTQIDRIYKHLGFNNQIQMVIWATTNGLRNNGHVQNRYLFDGYTNLPWD